jgi:predicted aspartyl protease
MRAWMAAAALALNPVLAFGGSDSAASGSQALLLDSYGGVVVPVMLNDAGPFRFLLDTGSSRTAVSASAVRGLGVRAVASTTVVTPTGTARRPLVPFTHVRVGTAAPAGVLAMVVADGDVLRGRQVDGLIGQDVLARLAFTIDYRDRRLIWQSLAAVDDMPGERLMFDYEGGRPIVSLPQPSASAPLRFVLDSGAGTIVLFPRPGRPQPDLTPLEIGRLRSVTGEQVVRRVRVDALVVGRLRLLDAEAIVVPQTASDVLGDGLLPLHLFDRVTFDGPRRQLILERR